MVFILENDPAYVSGLAKTNKKTKDPNLVHSFIWQNLMNIPNVPYMRLGFLE
jgi:hypothetical protein